MKGSLPKTSKQYYLAVNHEALYRRAKELGYEGIIILKNNRLSESQFEMIRKSKKSIGVLFFIPGTQYDDNTIFEQLDETDISNYGYNLYCDENYSYHATTVEEAVKVFPDPETFEKEMISEGVILDTDYTNRCGNCHRILRPKDKYCRHCGLKKGTGDFQPFKNISYGVYGSPHIAYYDCPNCGNHWSECYDGSNYTYYCPVCGWKDILIKEEEGFPTEEWVEKYWHN